MNVWGSSLKNMIVGVGTDNYRFFNSLNDYSHSTISETLVCTGIIGFGLYFSSFFSIIAGYIKQIRFSNADTKIIIILVLIFLLSFLFFSVTAVMYDDRLFWPLLGMICSYSLAIKEKN